MDNVHCLSRRDQVSSRRSTPREKERRNDDRCLQGGKRRPKGVTIAGRTTTFSPSTQQPRCRQQTDTQGPRNNPKPVEGRPQQPCGTRQASNTGRTHVATPARSRTGRPQPTSTATAGRQASSRMNAKRSTAQPGPLPPAGKVKGRRCPVRLSAEIGGARASHRPRPAVGRTAGGMDLRRAWPSQPPAGRRRCPGHSQAQGQGHAHEPAIAPD